ncbi:Maf-like protein [Undibacterium cyanobacteriorum]|uniref:7-methyl-GTP pyrophosphatase n=1 Tax=Undibacterium cyanobacteriorum TaxID=3073561 RepID=A0ABY9RMG3_9BURK|nr:Maf-like protein [Undibacterium sp. 20NA77.5]WMW82394.1 Maf-like protein [Undibacterium sp. 20NA77.5]
MQSTFQLILASSSPYRRELLARLQLPFTSIAPDIDESPQKNEGPADTAIRLAREKAQHIAASHTNSIVIGSDQVATLDDLQIGKPGNHERAMEQLRIMQGREVIFHTALCVLDGRSNVDTPNIQEVNSQTRVRFRSLSEAELDAYLRIEKPYDCAGSAKNEGLGIALIESIHSDDPTSLTGLPLIALTDMLRNRGVPFFGT